jgi:prepilin-type processing-associated H-X9-DG protein
MPSNGTAAGVFHNLHIFPNRSVNLDFLSSHDGSSTTVMLSENVHATEWSVPSGGDTTLTPWQAETSIVWWRNYATGVPYDTPFVPNAPYDGKIAINAGKDDLGGTPPGDIPPALAAPPESNLNGWVSAANATDFLAYARPSSRHPGGVIISFCDGHNQFVAETVEYDIYRGMMTPWGARYGMGVLDSSAY